MKRRFIFCLILMILLFVTGCGFKDIDKRFFVTQLGVDLTEDKDKPYKITVKLAVPKPKIEPGQEDFLIVQESAATLTDAVRLMKSKVDKELDFGHCTVILFGEKLARENIRRPLDWFVRRRDIQEISYLATATPDAETVLRIKPKSERLPGNAFILSFGEAGTRSAYIVTEYLFDFFRRLTVRGLDPLMPVIEATGDKDYDIRHVALFNKSKLVEILNKDETRLLNEMAFGNPRVDVVPETKDIKMAISFENLKINHSIVTPKQGDPHVSVKIKADGIVEEASHPLSEKQWSEYQRETEESSNKMYLQLLRKLQKLNLDPIGFGEDYLASHFKGDESWQEWLELYPKIDFDINTKIRIKGPGNIR